MLLVTRGSLMVTILRACKHQLSVFCSGKNLDMNKTLQQNSIDDESEAFYELNMDEDDFLPAIHLYFNDDLTEF